VGSVLYENPAPSRNMSGGAPGIRRGVRVCDDEDAMMDDFGRFQCREDAMGCGVMSKEMMVVGRCL